jgi:hypothetical protein
MMFRPFRIRIPIPDPFIKLIILAEHEATKPLVEIKMMV